MHRLSSNPDLRITKHYPSSIRRLIGSQNTDLALAIGAIANTVHLLTIHIKVKRVSLCDDRKRVGLIQSSVNCWRHGIHHRPGMRTVMDDEAVMPVLANSEAIEIARRS